MTRKLFLVTVTFLLSMFAVPSASQAQLVCPSGYGLCAAGWCCPLGGNTCCNSNDQAHGCTTNGVCSTTTTTTTNNTLTCPSGEYVCGDSCCISNPQGTNNVYYACPDTTDIMCNSQWCCPSGFKCCPGNPQSEGCVVQGNSCDMNDDDSSSGGCSISRRSRHGGWGMGAALLALLGLCWLGVRRTG
jgi:hypothetical protein